ncbi:MAG: hypothetical protein QE271_01540 [Bacteriovoracaceae bacterium]|nr:hypothetical protein [Bacteriovoracaceae bacterium]
MMKKKNLAYLGLFLLSFNLLAQAPSVEIFCHGKFRGMNVEVNVPKTEEFYTRSSESTANIRVKVDSIGHSFDGYATYYKGIKFDKSTKSKYPVYYYSIFDTSIGYLCSWSDCDIRNLKFNLKTIDNIKATGNISFKVKVEGKKIKFKVPLECDLNH